MLEYMKRLREPYAGKPPVRFDEGENDNGQRREYLSTRIVLSTLLNGGDRSHDALLTQFSLIIQ